LPQRSCRIDIEKVGGGGKVKNKKNKKKDFRLV
jgi:hypothetical protein